MLRVVFFGTPDFAVIPLKALAEDPRYEVVGVVTQPDRPVGRNRVLTPPPVKQAALELGIPVLQPETLRDPEAFEALAAWNYDVGVVAAYGEILRKNVLELPRLGYLNIHPSLLPLYRGPAPVNGAILAGDAETGVSVMLLERKMDAGPLLAQTRVALTGEERAGEFTIKMFELGSKMLCDVLEPYAKGELEPTPQDNSLATFTHMISKSDGVVDWQQSAAQIERMTRAYDPWPGVVTTFRDQPLKILAAKAHADAKTQGVPGQLVEYGTGLAVVTGDGLLELVTVQPAGKRAIAASEWRRGLREISGIVLG